MKKFFILTLLAAAAAPAGYCAADTYKYTPYVGLGYAFDKAQVSSVRPEYHSAEFYIGSDYSKYFGTEVFLYQSLSRTNGQQPHKLKSSYRAYGLDLMGYLPLDCSQKFSLLGTIGAGEYVFKYKETGFKHHNEHGYGYRFGGGFKYALNNNWQARFVARYINFDGADKVNQAVEYGVNVEYHF